MKKFIIILSIVWVISNCYLLYAINNYANQVEENCIAIYSLITYSNHTQFTIMDTENRILHYISKHDHPIIGCPECGLLQSLDRRKKEISEEMSSLNISPEKLEKLRLEEASIDKYMFLPK